MSLKFKCQNCGSDIIVRYLKVGETARCKACGTENVVPETAAENIEEADYLKHGPISEKEPELIASTTGMEQQSEDSAEQNPFQHLKVRSLLLWMLSSYFALAFILFLFKAPDHDLLFTWSIRFWSPGLILIWALWKFNRFHISLRRIIGNLPTRDEWLLAVSVVIPLLLFGVGSGILIGYLVSSISPSLLKWLFPKREFTTPLVFSAIVLAPPVEELLFRGILIHRWTVKWDIRRAVLISSLIFSIGHLGGAVWAFVHGFVWAVLYIRTRKLLVPIVSHTLYNAIVSCIRVLANRGALPSSSILRSWFMPGCMILSLFWVIYFMYRNWPHQSWAAPYFTTSLTT
jgi:membrane protease YdiL (CAAX protease family)/DNA-directed RNA polymerase subunit RPC12/RpoP